MKRVFFLLACLSLSNLLFAGKFWEEKPFTQWNEEEARKILTDSPWTKVHVTRTFLGGSAAAQSEHSAQSSAPPGTRGPGGAPALAWEARSKCFVHFLTAAPVRMAIARLHMVSSNWSEEQARQFVQTAPFGDRIAVSLFVEVAKGQNKFELDHLTTARLKNDTYLHLKKSKKKIYLEEYLPPAPGEGRPEAILLFPRVKDDALRAEKDIRFNCKLFFDPDPTTSDTTRKTEIKLKFKLKKMVFEGKLEL
jgi:hypothetical protein